MKKKIFIKLSKKELNSLRGGASDDELTTSTTTEATKQVSNTTN